MGADGLSWPASQAGDTSVTADVLCLLRDPRYRFPAHHQEALGRWLPEVLPACYSWPPGAALVWNEAPCAAPVQQVLRVGPGEITHNGQRQCGLVARWEDPHAGAAGTLAVQHFIAPPGDLFDAVALALTLRQPGAAPPGVAPRGGSLSAMTLREELADWLQTPAGQHCSVPALSDVYASADAALLEDPQWMASHGDALARELAAFLVQEAADDPPLSALPVEIPIPQPRPPDAALADAMRTLCGGGWSVALDHLVPTLLVRLPVSHPCRVNSLLLSHTGQEIQYTRPGQSCDGLSIIRQSDGRLMRRFWSPEYTTFPGGPDDFLEAVTGCRAGELSQHYPQLREELAEIVAMNPELVRLRLALVEQAFPGDHEVLLRLCRIHGQLTPAGEQLLDPGRPQRAVQAADMHRWFDSRGSAFRRLPAQIAQEGISVLDAHRMASPLRPTVQGNPLMGLRAFASLPAVQPDTVALLRQVLPELRYAYRSTRALIHYLRTAIKTFHAMVPAEVLAQADRFVKAAGAAEIVALPGQRQPPRPGV